MATRYKNIPVPAKYLGRDLTEEEKNHVAANYGKQPMTGLENELRGAEEAADAPLIAAAQLAALKDAVYDHMQAKLDAGFSLYGATFYLGADGKSDLLGAVINAAAGRGVEWVNGAVTTSLTAQQVQGVGAQAAAFTQQQQMAKSAAIAKIDSAEVSTAQDAIAAYDEYVANNPLASL